MESADDDIPETANDHRCPRCGSPLEEADAGICPVCVARSLVSSWDTTLAGTGYMEALAARLPEYRFARFLGSGGMGEVYLVQMPSGKAAALKVLRADLLGDPEAHARVRRECEALMKLTHAGIPEIYEVGEVDGVPYLAMEFIDGPTLREILKSGAAPVDKALAWMRDVGAALAAAHDAGLVHRDIKPNNVIIAKNGRAMLADFGLSGQSAGISPLTHGALGAPFYVAPEVVAGKPADARSDVYSLGVLLHELLCGQPPRAGSPPPSAKSGCSRRVDAVVDRALADDPLRRFADARGFGEALASAAARRKAGLAAAVAGAGVFGAAAAGGWLWYQSDRAQHEGGEPPPFWVAPGEPATPAFTNSLGMPFIRIEGADPLFCIFETRVQDFSVYSAVWQSDDRKELYEWLERAQFGAPNPEGMRSLCRDGWQQLSDSWSQPGFDITPAHPVCGVSWFDAKGFCSWLTWRERARGLIGGQDLYRLPTDAEWSAAAGIAAFEPEGEPADRHLRADDGTYPWGISFPPPSAGWGNYGYADAVDRQWPDEYTTIAGADGFPRTAPAGSFAASPTGLFDLSGNVWEWTESRMTEGKDLRVARGGSWFNAKPEHLRLDFRDSDLPTSRVAHRGFRIVLQRSGE